jgi:hypothetical protein
MTTQMVEYQNRLRALVREAKGTAPLRELARRMGDENLRTSLCYWMGTELSRPLRPASYEALAIVDPQGRTPSELEYWLRTGETLPNVEFIPQVALMRALLAS